MKLKIKLKTFWILSAFLIIIFSGFSVFQISSLASEIKLIQFYEIKLERIKMENEALIVNFTQINSLDNNNELIKFLDFVRIDDVYHIKLLEDIVGQR
jgi:endonuclease III-like uncharacterized protein